MQHVNFFRNLDTVVRELDARGHETVMLHGTRMDDPVNQAKLERKRKKQKMAFMGRGIQVAEAQVERIETGYRPEPVERRHIKLRGLREVVNRAIYLRKNHPSPERVAEALEKRMSPRTRRLIRFPAIRWLLRTRTALRAWRFIEKRMPVSETVKAVIEDVEPDIVLISPSIWPKTPIEADYMHAAQRLGIPTIGYLNSWDNLTSKGTVHVLPDVFIVWNEALAEEAEQLHDIPRRIIEITGAPHLDHFFELRPSLSRAELCRSMGLPNDGPYVVYFCSSRTLIENENHIATSLAEALASELGADAPSVLVRPHPVSAETWDGYEHPGVTVFPKLGDQADTPEAWQEYFDQLTGALCFVGLNTTAFLEAAVADRPCLTIVSDEYHAVQGRTGHFRHLLAGDFLEVSSSMAEVAVRVRRITDGADERAGSRRRFVESFLRPRGLDTRAAAVVADTIEELAGKRAMIEAPTTERRAETRAAALRGEAS